jgi:hypothetical protein
MCSTLEFHPQLMTHFRTVATKVNISESEAEGTRKQFAIANVQLNAPVGHAIFSPQRASGKMQPSQKTASPVLFGIGNFGINMKPTLWKLLQEGRNVALWNEHCDWSENAPTVGSTELGLHASCERVTTLAN